MKGFFCSTHAKNNEAYRLEIKKRMLFFAALTIIGAIAAVIGFGAEYWGVKGVSDYMVGFYSGTGVGLFFAGIILLISHYRLLKNEEKLKENRLKESDERLKEISQKAFKVATFTMFIVMYVGIMVMGLFYPILTKAMLVIGCVFLLTYVIANRYYESKM